MVIATSRAMSTTEAVPGLPAAWAEAATRQERRVDHGVLEERSDPGPSSASDGPGTTRRT